MLEPISNRHVVVMTPLSEMGTPLCTTQRKKGAIGSGPHDACAISF